MKIDEIHLVWAINFGFDIRADYFPIWEKNLAHDKDFLLPYLIALHMCRPMIVLRSDIDRWLNI
jgi:hypothetical protein